MASYMTTGYHEDSDADDEYERSVVMSPSLPPDFESSPTDSEAPSTEQTPTSFFHREPPSPHGQGFARDIVSPSGLITDWTPEQCSDFVSSLGLPQYADSFIDESIAGDALVALVHSDLKEIGIQSIGHRLTILKGVYELKVKQNIPIEPEHYIPLSAEETQETAPTQDDIARIIRIIKDRDADMRLLKDDLVRLAEENRKLREDVLPLIKQAKDRSQPLPIKPEDHHPAPEIKSSGLSRKFSTKRLFLSGSGPKNPSPTTIPEGRTLQDTSSLDPSAAAMAASTHLTASMRDTGSPSQPSPTSPAYAPPNSAGPPARSFPRESENTWTSQYSNTSTVLPERSASTRDPPLSAGSAPGSATPGLLRESSAGTGSTSNTQASASGGGGSGGGTPGSSNPQVEIFKSFRVSIDDPCHKVLPVALKKYNITADWRQYALYIVHGDQERCLGLNERPLILFKQLDREGRKPMFMLRKHASPMEGSVQTISQPPTSASPGQGPNDGGRFAGGAVQLPGGVL
ncbi:RA-domain-containing protein [Trichodelitschia bisporula]|uniref:RA-domain-containing protein n=1 Tax=Trichodelitschia bisporula TaxID=703511 RepID=A0A6G1HLH9_9PEZI|nr:RA-domain-containing protein [Trichodelitschia bisporula]